MNAPDYSAIQRLHQVYVKLTGLNLSFHMGHESTWREWIAFRRGEPFTEADLRFVLLHLKRGIQNGERNMGSLKFSNLIGQPDMFEQDLLQYQSLARAGAKPRPPATIDETTRDEQGTVTRRLPNPNTQDTSRPASAILPPEKLGSYIEEMRKAAGIDDAKGKRK